MDAESTIDLLTGNKMPIIGYGTWGMKGNVAEAVAIALDAGYRMIDTAEDYGSQKGIGEALQTSGKKRSNLFIVTKVEEDQDAYEATLRNLEELQLDYADLTVIHRPPDNGAGVALWKGLIRAQEEGKVRDIGVSNYSEQQIQTLIDETGVTPAVNQIEWSPFGWSEQMLEFCLDHNIIIQAYSPLTHGKYIDDPTLQTLSDKYSKTPGQILLRWAVQQGVVPLPKSDDAQHIRENIDIFDFDLEDDDMDILNELNEDFSALAEKPIYQLHR